MCEVDRSSSSSGRENSKSGRLVSSCGVSGVSGIEAGGRCLLILIPDVSASIIVDKSGRGDVGAGANIKLVQGIRSKGKLIHQMGPSSLCWHEQCR